MTRKLSTKFTKMVNKLFPARSIKESLRQKHCYLCKQTIYKTLPICDACYSDLPWNNKACNICALPLPALTLSSRSITCGKCLSNEPSYSQCISAFSYTFPINTLISDFKYNKQRHFGKLMAKMLAFKIDKEIQNKYIIKPDYLMPVPLHINRFDNRGFNQSEDICIDLSKLLNIPIDRHSLQRTINTPSQTALTKLERQKNLHQAFQINKSFNGEVIALVDDVITTGATIECLSTLLLNAGAKEVFVWSLARTPLAH